MFDSSELRDELQALKGDVSRLLNTTGEGILDASKNRAEALADQIKAALNDLGDIPSEQEGHVRIGIAPLAQPTMGPRVRAGSMCLRRFKISSIQSVSFTSQMPCSTGSALISNPRLRHIVSITVFS